MDVDDVRASIIRFGQRYLRRVFTRSELADAIGHAGDADPVALSQTFAAKEAVVKAMGFPASAALAWPDVEIRHRGGRRPSVHLHGSALDWALAHRRNSFHVSISGVGHGSSQSRATGRTVMATAFSLPSRPTSALSPKRVTDPGNHRIQRSSAQLPQEEITHVF